jgi:hypothetical protein
MTTEEKMTQKQMEDYKDDSKDIILTLDSLIVPMFHLGWA